MADIRGFLKLKNAAGGFDVIYPKTDAVLVSMADGKTVEAAIAALVQDVADNNGAVTEEIADVNQAIADNKAAAEAKDAELEQAIADNKAAAEAKDGELAQAIADNKAAAEAKEAELAQDIADNKAAAEAKDAELEAAIGENAQAIADNKAAAEAKDAELAQDIADNKAAAEAKDAELAQDIADNKAAAEAKDAELVAKDAELEAAIGENAQAIADNKAAAEAKDAELAQDIADNKAAAEAKDAELAQAIADNKAAAEAKDGELVAKDAELAQAIADNKAAAEAKDAELVAKDAELEAAIGENAQAIADNKAAAEAKDAELVAKDAELAQAIADNKAAAEAKDAELVAKDGELEAAIADIHTNANKANGVVKLDAEGLVPAAFIPNEFKEIKVVNNLDERNAIADTFSGLSVFVKDASADETVNNGGAYYLYDGAAWVKTAEAESLDVVLNWTAIQGKPDTLAGYGITDGVNVADVVTTATANKILKLNADGKLPADVTGNAATASKFQVAANVEVAGDDVVTYTTTFDGATDLALEVVLNDTGVTAGQYTKVTVDAKGRVTAAANLEAADIPELDWAKITSGKPTTLEGYGITDAVNKGGDTMTGMLTLAGAPTEDLHAATKAYVDSLVQGLDVKASVRCATTENVVLAGLQTIDGVAVAAGDRVLVKNQNTAAENGIYIVADGAWMRAGDAANGNMNPGLFTFVEQGNVNANSGFVLANNGTEFSQFSGMGQVIAGAGIGKNGNEIFLTDTGVGAGTYTKVTVDAKGRVTAATNLAPEDLPEVAWAVITGKPQSAVADIDDAVAKRHAHANAAQLEKVGENADGVMTYNGNAMATQTFVQSMIQVGDVEPADMPVGGLWIEIPGAAAQE